MQIRPKSANNISYLNAQVRSKFIGIVTGSTITIMYVNFKSTGIPPPINRKNQTKNEEKEEQDLKN